VLIEVPVMLMLVKICVQSQGWFNRHGDDPHHRAP